jgi:putative tricarboxylic transport membrane protein
MDRSTSGSRPGWGCTAIGLAVLGLAAILAWQIAAIPANAVYAQVGPAVIPWIATGMLGVLGTLLTVQGLLGGWEHELPEGFQARGLGWMLLGLALNVTLIGVVGFIIASTLLFVCTARAFRSRNMLRDALIGFAMALISYVGFDRVLGYKIGSGLIEGLL